MSLGQNLSVCAKELGDGNGVPLVGLDLPQRGDERKGSGKKVKDTLVNLN